MTIHLFPVSQARSVPRGIAETHALFLVREAVSVGVSAHAPTLLHDALDQLVKSDNAAVASEAKRLKGQLHG